MSYAHTYILEHPVIGVNVYGAALTCADIVGDTGTEIMDADPEASIGVDRIGVITGAGPTSVAVVVLAAIA